MRQLEANFTDSVRGAWGKPDRVANAGINELWKHVKDQDHDDQVEHAKRIGILAGQTAEKTPEAFLEGFASFLHEFDE